MVMNFEFRKGVLDQLSISFLKVESVSYI